MKVARATAFTEAVENIAFLKQSALCSIIRVQFRGESGLDAGAIQREWYLLVAQGFLDDAAGLFMVTNRDDNAYFINPNAAAAMHRQHMTTSRAKPPGVSHSQAFRAAGRFIGRALLDGQMLPLHFCPGGQRSLRFVLDHDNADDLCLTFSATERQDDTIVEVDLVAGGRDIAVTDANKHEYVDLMTRYLLFDRIDDSLRDMIQGLHADDDSMRGRLTNGTGLTSYDGKICYFTLKGITYTPGGYPCAHACYNRIDLPMYPRKDLMEDALTMLLLSDPTGFNIE
ncbi:hypothetical protein DYB25_001944 [Aphanomyces astaci]|nr:hypothetical protein DYB25_001944 [Aphanomyces astaci]